MTTYNFNYYTRGQCPNTACNDISWTTDTYANVLCACGQTIITPLSVGNALTITDTEHITGIRKQETYIQTSDTVTVTLI